ncbi:MAG: hypothetical protein QNJ98_13840 [Planctomycetota bacterium]|nr:hypothetical protein [Planctomycetota bacterium]
MHQLQFLGRTAKSPERAHALREFAQFHRIAQQGSMPMDVLESHLRTMGFHNEEIAALMADPIGASHNMLRATERAGDLFEELEYRAAPVGLVSNVRAFADAIADVRQPLVLDRCERDDGDRFAISYHLPSCSSAVSEGDLFFAGVALAANAIDGTVAVAPRVVRQVCANGMVQVTHLTGQRSIFRCDADGTSEGVLANAIRAGLSQENVTAVAHTLRPLTAIRVRKPFEALAERGVVVPESAVERVQNVFEENGDPTVYGALNALTQTARDATDVAERMELETRAGFVLGDMALLLDTAFLDAVEVA